MFDLIIKEVGNRFNLGDKALPLVQAFVAAMTQQQTGGLAGFMDRFKSNGLGYLLESWVGGSAPLSINHAQIEDVLGGKGAMLETICSKIGLDKGNVLLGATYLLPKLVGLLAPAGKADLPLAPEVTNFAEKGMALLGLGGVASSVLAVNANTGGSAATPILERAAVHDSAPVKPAPVVQVAASVEDAPPKQVPPPVSIAKVGAARPAVATASQHEEESKGGFLKYLLWLLPLILGIWLLKTCSQAPDETTVQSESAIPPVAETAPAAEAPAFTPVPDVNTEIVSGAVQTGAEELAPGVPATPSVPVDIVAASADAVVTSANEVAAAASAVAAGATDAAETAADVVSTSVAQALPSAPDSASTASTVAPATAMVNSTGQASSLPTAVNEDSTAVDASGIPVAKVYFNVGKIRLPADVRETLAPVVEYVKANPSAKIVLSGFHDPTGRKKWNQWLAKHRAQKVMAKLRAAGIPKNAIVMAQPQSTRGSGDNAEARRVEITITQ